MLQSQRINWFYHLDKMFEPKSRTHSGEHLLKRSMRHALDKDTPSMMEAHISAAKCKNKFSMIIENKVKPNMIQGMCNVIFFSKQR